MKIYHIALGIIILSATLGMVNDMGIFVSPLPTQTFDSAQGKVTALTNTTLSTDLSSDFFGVFMIIKALGYLTSALTSAIVIIPLLSQYQVPLAVSAPIQGIIWFVYGMGLFQLITGRSTKLYD